MTRHVDKDKFGGDIEYIQSDEKKCPICRQESEIDEVENIKLKFNENPDLEDNIYYL